MLDLREKIKGNPNDYIIVMLGDTTPIMKGADGKKLVLKNDAFRKTVEGNKWDNTFLEENHDSFYKLFGGFGKLSEEQKKDFIDKNGLSNRLVMTFENTDGFIDLWGKKVAPNKLNNNTVFYGVYELNARGKKVLEANKGKKIKTSSYFFFDGDKGREAQNHGVDSNDVEVVEGDNITPISISLLTDNSNPLVNISTDYARGYSLNSQEKKTFDIYFTTPNDARSSFMDDKSKETETESVNGEELFKKLDLIVKAVEDLKADIAALKGDTDKKGDDQAANGKASKNSDDGADASKEKKEPDGASKNSDDKDKEGDKGKKEGGDKGDKGDDKNAQTDDSKNSGQGCNASVNSKKTIKLFRYSLRNGI